MFIFKVTEPSPLQDSSSVRQKGLPGPPPRNPRSRIHRCPGGLSRGSIAHVGKRFVPELFPGIGVFPGPATESHIVIRGTPENSSPFGQPQPNVPEKKSHPCGKPLQPYHELFEEPHRRRAADDSQTAKAASTCVQ